MRNDNTTLGSKILEYVNTLPYFDIHNLTLLNASQYHLRIVLSRLVAKASIVRLKKGLYVSSEYINKMKIDNTYSAFLEFIATRIYEPSYLSLEYILYENNMLTDVPVNITLVTRKKTYRTKNKLGTYKYHKIKDELFYGYHTKKVFDFVYNRASKAKAMFDFLYLRRKHIAGRQILDEYRLNMQVFHNEDWEELMEYVRQTGSKKMTQIYDWLKHHD